jgi:elongator complex protein 3
MPKSYLSREPGAQRAGRHAFDPARQIMARLHALDAMGHPIDKIELIILGGTWSFYPESYQLWFIKQCFEAMNNFRRAVEVPEGCATSSVDYAKLDEKVDGRFEANPYNDIVSQFLRKETEGGLIDTAHAESWENLLEAHRRNEGSSSRCIGLSVETRPDHVNEGEAIRIRRLGATKVQIGIQSLSDEILAANKRGHDVADTRRAIRLLRRAGFKIQAHWMPNLYGSSPERDIEDFDMLFSDRDFRPDELKIYPCSLIESAELVVHYEAGRWRPYTQSELTDVLTECLKRVVPYCRVSRVIRDIPGEDIFVGNKVTNFRNVAEAELERKNWICRDIRAREIRDTSVRLEDLKMDEIRYETSAGKEVFIQYVTHSERIVGFLRLCLPEDEAYIDELQASALIREVHVYGAAVGIGKKDEQKFQHTGLGTKLIERAKTLSRQEGFGNLAVISSVGTREYYRRLGFKDRDLYQHVGLRNG